MEQSCSGKVIPVVTKTVSDQVYDRIKASILNGQYSPGTRIVQEEFTQQFQVSRTPVREAFQRLKSEGLIVTKPFYGAEVFSLSLDELQEVYDVRIQIEIYSAQKACERFTDQEIDELEQINRFDKEDLQDISLCMEKDRKFHRYICCRAVSPYIITILESLWDKCDPYKSLYFMSQENISYMINEHEAMVKYLRKRDKEKLAIYIRRHLQDVVMKISAVNNLST